MKAQEFTGYSDAAFSRTIPEMNQPLSQQPPLMAALRSRKDELITFLRDAHRSADQGMPTLRPMARPTNSAEGMPLSFAQQRLWFLQRFDPTAASYSEYAALRLDGSLDRAALLEVVLG